MPAMHAGTPSLTLANLPGCPFGLGCPSGLLFPVHTEVMIMDRFPDADEVAQLSTLA